MYNKSTFLKMDDKRDNLNNLIESSNDLTSSDIINLSQELDKLIIVCQVEMNKKSDKVH
ncbi:aspartyl-phosphate phosphatase Spo0E family protein [Anaeromonas frigoriresistens]|nr:aspartyl-phosphate phosphatase Spo0E family protein [Anaeromonas frigoriresistens]